MIATVSKLIDDLNNAKVDYCHWKSNDRLDEVFAGETDIDLLVGRGSSTILFNEVISRLGFKQAYQQSWEKTESVEHYYAYDHESGLIVHLHVYFRVISGGALLKNYHLPVEKMLLENCDEINGMQVPSRVNDLIILVLRKIIEHGNPIEFFLLTREYKNIQKELDWLLRDYRENMDGLQQECCQILSKWLPSVDNALFWKALNALVLNGNPSRRFWISIKMRRALKNYRLLPPMVEHVVVTLRLLRRIVWKFVKKQRTQRFAEGGSVFAVVGPEATGKSTVIGHLVNWLSEHFMIVQVHAGKPPASFLTSLPRLFLPYLRKLLPSLRSSSVEVKVAKSRSSDDLSYFQLIVFAARSIWLAVERRRLLVRAFRKATRGHIVICDRYPSSVYGAMDSPQLDLDSPVINGSFILRAMAQLEHKIYRTIPIPDHVLKLTVPVEVAVQRNVKRNKTEDETYLRRRHAQSEKQKYPFTKVTVVDTNTELEDSLSRIKSLIWASI